MNVSQTVANYLIARKNVRLATDADARVAASNAMTRNLNALIESNVEGVGDGSPPVGGRERDGEPVR
jgi:hypothetical protein